jgi:hypothetical protein
MLHGLMHMEFLQLRSAILKGMHIACRWIGLHGNPSRCQVGVQAANTLPALSSTDKRVLQGLPLYMQLQSIPPRSPIKHPPRLNDWVCLQETLDLATHEQDVSRIRKQAQWERPLTRPLIGVLGMPDGNTDRAMVTWEKINDHSPLQPWNHRGRHQPPIQSGSRHP